MASTSSKASDSEPARGGNVVFEEVCGIFWLSGHDLELAQTVLGIRTEEVKIGLEPAVALSYVTRLQRQKLRVAVRRPDGLSFLVSKPEPPEKPPSKRVQVAPAALIGLQELKRLSLKASRNRSFASLVKEAKAGACDDALIYVYAVSEAWFEVDWGLTCVSEMAFEARALAAHQVGSNLACLLVQPKPKRTRASSPIEVRPQLVEPETFGQLSLPI